MEYSCPCGKKHRSRTTVSRHRKALAEKDSPFPVPKGQKGTERDVLGGQKGTSSEDKKGQDRGQKGTEKGQSYIKEINLKGEFDRMGEIVNPKKDEKKDEGKYECGACHGKFSEKYTRCPHCGVEFE